MISLEELVKAIRGINIAIEPGINEINPDVMIKYTYITVTDKA